MNNNINNNNSNNNEQDNSDEDTNNNNNNNQHLKIKNKNGKRYNELQDEDEDSSNSQDIELEEQQDNGNNDDLVETIIYSESPNIDSNSTSPQLQSQSTISETTIYNIRNMNNWRNSVGEDDIEEEEKEEEEEEDGIKLIQINKIVEEEEEDGYYIGSEESSIESFDDINIQDTQFQSYNNGFKYKLSKYSYIVKSSIIYYFNLFIQSFKYIFQNSKLIHIWRSLIGYSINNIKRNKLNFIIGFISCFLVVFLVSTGLSILSNISLIYLSQADYQSGGVDVILNSINIPNQPNRYGQPTGYPPSLNFTLINQLLDNNNNHNNINNNLKYNNNNNNNDDDDDDFKNITPRSNKLNTIIYPSNNCSTKFKELEYRYHGSTVIKSCKVYSDIKKYYVIDIKREYELGFDTTFGLKETLPSGSLLMDKECANQFNLNIGDQVYLNINPYEIFPMMWNNSKPDVTKRFRNIYALFKIHSIYNNNTIPIVLDYKSLFPYISTQIDPQFSNFTKEYIASSNLYEYSQNVIMRFPSPRLDMYRGTDIEKTLQRVLRYTSRVLYRVGFNLVKVQIPVMDELYKSKELSSNLGLLLNIIVFVFSLLSVLLIYSTLMVDVDTMTFNNGVFRMIGASLTFVTKLMISKTLIFAIPSIVFGLIFSQLFLMVASSKLKEISGEEISNTLTVHSILYALLFGLAIPSLSLILPVRKAIKKSLSESIDTTRSKMKGVKISIKKNDSSEFRFNIAVIGLCLTIIGFSTYFFLPRAMVSGNIQIVLNLVFILILVSLVGALFLMVNFHMMISKSLIFIMTIFDSKAIRSIVFKNILAHKHKNRNTVFMFGVSISLIVMISSLYQIQSDIEAYNYRHYVGSFIKIENDHGVFKKSTAQSIFNILDQLYPEVEEYSYVSRDFKYLSNPKQSQFVSNLGRLYNYQVDLNAVSPSFYQHTLNDLFKVSSYDKNSGDNDIKIQSNKDLSYALYSKDSMTKALIGSGYKELIGTSYQQSFLLESKVVLNVSGSSKTTTDSDGGTVTIPVTPYSSRYVLKPLAFVESSPLYYFSKNPNNDHQSLLVSFPSFTRFTNGYLKSVRDVPISSFIIKPRYTDKSSINQLMVNLNLSSLRSDAVYSLSLYKNDQQYENSNQINSIFFNFATVISMIISTFSLVSSMYTNINEQTKEIGILRSIGLSKFAINRIYLYEAFSLSFGSCILAIIVGIFISYTVILEQIIITEIPLTLKLPFQLVLLVFISSIIISFISVLSPINKLLNKSIINIIKK